MGATGISMAVANGRWLVVLLRGLHWSGKELEGTTVPYWYIGMFGVVLGGTGVTGNPMAVATGSWLIVLMRGEEIMLKEMVGATTRSGG